MRQPPVSAGFGSNLGCSALHIHSLRRGQLSAQLVRSVGLNDCNGSVTKESALENELQSSDEEDGQSEIQFILVHK